MIKEKLVTISTRMNRENLEYLEKVSKTFKIDKSTALRKLLSRGVQEDKKERAIELYLKGESSLEGAAKFADMYIGEFLQLLKKEGIELNVTVDNYQEGLKSLKKIWNK